MIYTMHCKENNIEEGEEDIVQNRRKVEGQRTTISSNPATFSSVLARSRSSTSATMTTTVFVQA